VDIGHKGPKEKMVGNVVLRLKGRGRLDHQGLARVVEGAIYQERGQIQGTNRDMHINQEKHPD
jgi:hypothetical protein